MEKKPPRIPAGLRIVLYMLFIVMDPVGVLLLFKTLGPAGPAASVAYGMVVTLFVWPFLMRYGVSRLYTMRNEYEMAIRADRVPVVSVPQVLGLYALIFSPAFMLAFLSLALPWGVAMGIFLIPAVLLLGFFGYMHAGAWTELGLRRIWYVLYILALLAVSSLAGAVVNVLL